MSNANNPKNLPPLSPEQDRQATEGEKMLKEQPRMSLEELRKQTAVTLPCETKLSDEA